MIHWTTSGVVATPTTVQIRLTSETAGPLRVGANIPATQLSVNEFQENLHFFSVGLQTPRTIPCTSLTLSGLPENAAPYLSSIENYPDYRYRTLHLSTNPSWTELQPFLESFHRVVLPITDLTELSSIPTWIYSKVYLILALTGDTMLLEQWLEQWLPYILERNLRLIFSYPVPLSGTSPLSIPELLGLFKWLQPFLQQNQQLFWLKGIPPCLLPTLHATGVHISSRTSNRWYVDVEHQCHEARLFFPEMLQFHKDDQCRFCVLGGDCDGFFLSHLNEQKLRLSAFLE